MRGTIVKESFSVGSNSRHKIPTELLIGSLPNKMTFKAGETLDLTGLEIVVRYDDDTVKNITGDIVTDPIDGTTLSLSGKPKINISYTEGSSTISTSFLITVETKIVTWAEGTDEEIIAMVDAADRGIIDLTEYWNIGQERKITLGAMGYCPNEYYETHKSQTVSFVLMNAGGKELVNPTPSGRTTCSFIVGQKEVLINDGPMENYRYSTKGWLDCGRHTWCNEEYYKAIPEGIRSIFKLHKNYTRNTEDVTEDYIALPAINEIFETNSYSTAGLKQWDWYKTEANRFKYTLNGTTPIEMWTRTYMGPYNPYFDYGYIYYPNNVPSPASYLPYYSKGLAPFGVI